PDRQTKKYLYMPQKPYHHLHLLPHSHHCPHILYPQLCIQGEVLEGELSSNHCRFLVLLFHRPHYRSAHHHHHHKTHNQPHTDKGFRIARSRDTFRPHIH